LWCTAPGEQQLGRLHRPGQEAEVVLNDVYLPGAQAHRQFWRGVAVARNFAGKISGPQKLCYFENNVPEELDFEGCRWANAVNTDVEGDA
jgi:hypothetical protein